jgi:hypothetical protein
LFSMYHVRQLDTLGFAVSVSSFTMKVLSFTD